MALSKAHKYFNKFTGWARREGMVKAEEAEAMDEFFVAPGRVPADSRDLVIALFSDWFLLERKLTRAGMSPLELFRKTHRDRLDEREAEIYRAMAEDSRFGVFKVTARKAGEWLDLRPVPRGKSFRVLDQMASEDGREDDFMIARLFPFQDHWVLPSFATRLPEETGYHLERIMKARKPKLMDELISHRLVLGMFVPPVDWEKEGLHRLRARLASVLQRWRVSDITVADIEKDILAAHEANALENPLTRVLLAKAPSAAAVDEAAHLLEALWNLTLPGEAHLPGPKERSLLHDMQRVVANRLHQEGPDSDAFPLKARELMREWLAAPQKELGGKSPGEAIREERAALGNPNSEIDYEMRMMRLEGGDSDDSGAQMIRRGIDLLQDGKAEPALQAFTQAYQLVKDDPEAYRVIGNMATAHLMMGNREEALAMLKAALKANPDYSVARNNLCLLGSMSPAEFKRRHKSGFFKKTIVFKKS